MKRRLFISLSLVFLLSVSVLNAGGGDVVELGASPKQVFSILGKPMGRMTKGTKTTWMYTKGSVVFEGKKVVKTTFKATREKKARSQALLETGKQTAATKSTAGAEQMRQMSRPTQTTAVPLQVQDVKTSAEYEKARADAAVKLSAAKARRVESLRIAKEALAAAEAEAKKEVAIDAEASAKKSAVALRAYAGEVKRIDAVYHKELAQINGMMKTANARYALFMAEQARLTKQRRDQQQQQLRQSTGSFRRAVQKTTYKKLAKGDMKCPTCGKMVVAPTGEVVAQAGKKLQVYECVDGHKSMSE